jgi:hypothetical protein
MKDYCSCVVRRGNCRKRNRFHPFGYAASVMVKIYVIAIVTILQQAHQFDVKMREPPLGDEDVQIPNLSDNEPVRF